MYNVQKKPEPRRTHTPNVSAVDRLKKVLKEEKEKDVGEEEKGRSREKKRKGLKE